MLKGAIIGLGKIAQESHLRALHDQEILDLACVTAAVDINPISRDLAGLKYSDINYYGSLEDLIKNESLDFIDICTPPDTHAELIRECLKNRYHILCEKPLTISMLEANELVRLVRNGNSIFMTCHQYKYSPIWQMFKTCAGEYSDLKSFVEINVYRTEADAGLKILNNHWRINKLKSGGGIIADTGVHYLNLCLWMFGQPVSVTARIFNLSHPDYEVEDTAIVTLEFGNAVVSINLTWGAESRANSATLVNSRVSLEYDGEKIIKKSDAGDEIFPMPDSSKKSTYTALYVDLFRDFFSRVRDGQNDLSETEEASRTVALMEKAYESARTGKTLYF